MLRWITRLVLLFALGFFAPGEAAARVATRVGSPDVSAQKLASWGSDPEVAVLRQAAALQAAEMQQGSASHGYDFASECLLAAENGVARQTTILGENVGQRVAPFAQRTGARDLGFGATQAEWNAMTPAQRWKLNDGMLRARINEGDAFRYIGQDPLRNPALRTQFDLTGSELLRLNGRGIPYEVVSPSEVMSVLGRP